MTYANLLDLAAGSFLLTAILITWRRELTALVALLAWQGAMLAALAFIDGIHTGDTALLAVAVGCLVLRGVVLPWLLTKALSAEAGRESMPLVNTTAALLSAAALVVVAFAVTRPLVTLEPTPGTRAVPAAIAVVLIAVFTMATRRRAVSQAIGFLMLDNAIAATAFLLTAGVPLIVELGASLDVLFAVLVLGGLTTRMRRAFGDADVHRLRELQD
jgi:hydrogenase-4 component E